MLIGFLESLAWYGHKMRAVPILLFWGQHRLLNINSIWFGNTEYTDLSTIGKQILKAPDISRFFLHQENISYCKIFSVRE